MFMIGERGRAMDNLLELDFTTFKNLIDNVYDEICIWDSNNRLIYVNKACYRHYGLYPEEMIGKKLDFFLDQENYWGPTSIHYIHKEKKPVIQKQRTLLGIEIETISIPILDEKGNVEYVVQCDRDSSKSLYKKLAPIPGFSVDEEMEPENLIYISDEMKSVVGAVNKIAKTKAPLLILGETGTGKNVIAKYVHERSERRNKPFISVNMASINPTVIESELFGYKKGAFTGASISGKKGLFEMANGGILFLDEISELPYDMQAKLLYAIQDEEITPVGGVHPIKLDIHILSATNCDLSKLVEAGKFRQDLYHRLNVFEVTVPPLRNRRVDILLLASHFLNVFNKKYNKCCSFSDKVLEVFKGYPWHGNVRELSNVVERTVLISDDNEIKTTCLPDSFFSIDNLKYSNGTDLIDSTFEQAMLEHEKEIISRAFQRYGSSRKVAAAMQISQSKANRLIRKHIKK